VANNTDQIQPSSGPMNASDYRSITMQSTAEAPTNVDVRGIQEPQRIQPPKSNLGEALQGLGSSMNQLNNELIAHKQNDDAVKNALEEKTIAMNHVTDDAKWQTMMSQYQDTFNQNYAGPADQRAATFMKGYQQQAQNFINEVPENKADNVAMGQRYFRLEITSKHAPTAYGNAITQQTDQRVNDYQNKFRVMGDTIKNAAMTYALDPTQDVDAVGRGLTALFNAGASTFNSEEFKHLPAEKQQAMQDAWQRYQTDTVAAAAEAIQSRLAIGADGKVDMAKQAQNAADAYKFTLIMHDKMTPTQAAGRVSSASERLDSIATKQAEQQKQADMQAAATLKSGFSNEYYGYYQMVLNGKDVSGGIKTMSDRLNQINALESQYGKDSMLPERTKLITLMNNAESLNQFWAQESGKTKDQQKHDALQFHPDNMPGIVGPDGQMHSWKDPDPLYASLYKEQMDLFTAINKSIDERLDKEKTDHQGMVADNHPELTPQQQRDLSIKQQVTNGVALHDLQVAPKDVVKGYQQRFQDSITTGDYQGLLGVFRDIAHDFPGDVYGHQGFPLAQAAIYQIMKGTPNEKASAVMAAVYLAAAKSGTVDVDNPQARELVQAALQPKEEYEKNLSYKELGQEGKGAHYYNQMIRNDPHYNLAFGPEVRAAMTPEQRQLNVAMEQVFDNMVNIRYGRSKGDPASWKGPSDLQKSITAVFDQFYPYTTVDGKGIGHPGRTEAVNPNANPISGAITGAGQAIDRSLSDVGQLPGVIGHVLGADMNPNQPATGNAPVEAPADLHPPEFGNVQQTADWWRKAAPYLMGAVTGAGNHQITTTKNTAPVRVDMKGLAFTKDQKGQALAAANGELIPDYIADHLDEIKQHSSVYNSANRQGSMKKSDQDWVRSGAHDLKVSPQVVATVLASESGFNPLARNGVHWGLWQASPNLQKQFGLDPNKPAIYGTYEAQIPALVKFAQQHGFDGSKYKNDHDAIIALKETLVSPNEKDPNERLKLLRIQGPFLEQKLSEGGQFHNHAKMWLGQTPAANGTVGANQADFINPRLAKMGDNDYQNHLVAVNTPHPGQGYILGFMQGGQFKPLRDDRTNGPYTLKRDDIYNWGVKKNRIQGQGRLVGGG
jgi:hypothetical protein